MMRGGKGFTLIELMIVVAIVGILAAIAIPAYNDYVTRSRRSDAFTALETVRAAQEMYRAERGFYAGAITSLAGCSSIMAGDNYTMVLAVTHVNASGLPDQYTITANTQGKQADDFDFRIDQNGAHWFDGGEGWRNDFTWEVLRKPPGPPPDSPCP